MGNHPGSKWNKAEVSSSHQKGEQKKRKPNTQGQGLDDTCVISLVLDQIVERGSQAGKYEKQKQYDNDFQGLIPELLGLQKEV